MRYGLRHTNYTPPRKLASLHHQYLCITVRVSHKAQVKIGQTSSSHSVLPDIASGYLIRPFPFSALRRSTSRLLANYVHEVSPGTTLSQQYQTLPCSSNAWGTTGSLLSHSSVLEVSERADTRQPKSKPHLGAFLQPPARLDKRLRSLSLKLNPRKPCNRKTLSEPLACLDPPRRQRNQFRHHRQPKIKPHLGAFRQPPARLD